MFYNYRTITIEDDKLTGITGFTFSTASAIPFWSPPDICTLFNFIVSPKQRANLVCVWNQMREMYNCQHIKQK